MGVRSIRDLAMDQRHTSTHISIENRMNQHGRGRLDQSLSFENIRSMATTLPYSQFDGMQPGRNWEYRLTGRYVFSQVFQMSVNMNLKQRGSQNLERYLRLEGRTNF